MNGAPRGIGEDYERQGYVFPLAVLTSAEAAAYRRELERIERDFAGHPGVMTAGRSHPHLVFPFVDEIVRRPEILVRVSEVLGPDLLVWAVTLFIKEAGSPDCITWHQDLTYWGLDSDREVTAWLALSPATPESGGMRFVPGSHRLPIVPHRDTFAEANMLSRGQEIATEVDEAEAIDVVLAPGEMSLHHGRMFHASHPNRSDDRRIGLSIQYITPDMRQVTARRDFAVLVQGEDRYGHFELMAPPRGLLDPGDLARVEEIAAEESRYFFAGAKMS
jgi:hypothetical protein